ncbi:MAG: DPP IV N-terminal domain-containing protein [Gemmatimonadetes bacterium]|nr:DPP IV N-terminal domain-containing protein [Gemmatimonadota bacterium]
MRLRIAFCFSLGAIAALAFIAPLTAQQPYQPVSVSASEYALAETRLTAATNTLVSGGSVNANWLPDERMWYRRTIPGGSQVILVDPARKTSVVCNATMSNCAGVPATANTAVPGGRGGRGGGGGGRGGRGGADAGPPLAMSPDGKLGAFIKDWNLWVRDVATNRDRQLTTDGSKYFGYATDNAGWTRSDRAILLWSPDSKKIATQQQDERNVREWHMTNVRVGQPVLQSWPYPLPGDSVVAMVHRVIIEVETGKMIRLKLRPEYHRATLGDDISMSDYKWSPDASRLALASTSRDHKITTMRVADAVTGDVRDLFTDTVATHFESRTGWRVLWDSNELLWYSQADDWGQLYLHDLTTGRLKNKVTSGEGPVTQVVHLDEKARTLWYMANGREPGQDPYFAHAYRVGLDGKGAVSLTPDDGSHSVQLSPSGKYLVDTYSKAEVPPVVAIRDAAGKLVLALEQMDISKLVAAGWKPPIRITMKADDGKTDIYGMMFLPTNLDPSKKYPIVNQAYPGPQSGSVGSRAFSAARGDRQALAELGFIVVSIDGRGTPGRSKSFHDHYYGKMGRDNTIPDQVAGMKDLARQYPYIDIDRAAMWGHSGGGFITAGAMFHYPDFFKVGIAESGNHDQRLYEDDWGERYQGLLTGNADGTDSYSVEANQEYAKNLKGKLLLAHGTLDTNVPPENTMVVVDALIKANKDFDLLMIPNAGHGYGSASNYMMRRRWDYFVQNLLGAEPPKNYEIGRQVTP